MNGMNEKLLVAATNLHVLLRMCRLKIYDSLMLHIHYFVYAKQKQPGCKKYEVIHMQHGKQLQILTPAVAGN